MPFGNANRLARAEGAPWPDLEREAHRRRCGNVEMARLCFWRDFQARWKPWKSPGPGFGLYDLRRPGLCHGFHRASFPQRSGRGPDQGWKEELSYCITSLRFYDVCWV